MQTDPTSISVYDWVLKHITLAGVILIGSLLAKDHKIWVRMTDQVDSMWKEFCDKHSIQYKSLRNGTK